MELVNQHAKGIMEECKLRARDAGLRFDDETLEYIVTNRDMIELSPKIMIPTLYDYWVHDVRVLSGKGMYEAYPSNPYETVINTRPAISFYNDNNPDWLNVMIFYHVLAHIDFFQNNLYYKNTWDVDLAGQALADKRLIAQLRSEKGRWVDYVIEFARGIDNLVGFHRDLNRTLTREQGHVPDRIDFYFDRFLQKIKSIPQHVYLKEIDRYNQCRKDHADFFDQVIEQHPEFEEIFQKEKQKISPVKMDVMEYILKYSSFLRREENEWMKSVIHIVRSTSLYFQPQIRTKTMNEGWASFWHAHLFLKDDRIRGHETDFAKVNATVTAMPKVGLNPYALGLRLFEHIQEMEDRGRYSLDYFQLKDAVLRTKYDRTKNTGTDYIFFVRENMDDFSFINTFVDQEFVDRHHLFVAGKRFNPQHNTWQYYIKSKKVADYKQMVINTLHHPPDIYVVEEKTRNGILYLNHRFENKPLKQDFIENTMIGIEFLWGGPVHLETSVPSAAAQPGSPYINFWDPGAAGKTADSRQSPIQWKRVRYVLKDRKLHKQEL
ncbi:SpoVR family protein [Desulfotignum phosphitoxidans]|uniref:SpoVR-like family protein n=1 Tax=Desulfotignum phosphitoxidans DSM 13687 TaxID=1286635 RepID=S0FX15_9BACT|nr:SpoVR family protein [Desulfotignum phosphitoxidans]EMS79255.1 SpoVR-like family protein [Desulfotignum phosphitoxidans DSM 13687]